MPARGASTEKNRTVAASIDGGAHALEAPGSLEKPGRSPKIGPGMPRGYALPMPRRLPDSNFLPSGHVKEAAGSLESMGAPMP